MYMYKKHRYIYIYFCVTDSCLPLDSQGSQVGAFPHQELGLGLKAMTVGWQMLELLLLWGGALQELQPDAVLPGAQVSALDQEGFGCFSGPGEAAGLSSSSIFAGPLYADASTDIASLETGDQQNTEAWPALGRCWVVGLNPSGVEGLRFQDCRMHAHGSKMVNDRASFTPTWLS